MKKINEKLNLYGDNIAKVEQYDFSSANLNEENRIKAITTVASICYQNPKAIGSESLYNRLLGESQGLPSSSFEFVPILLDSYEVANAEYYLINNTNKDFATLNIVKYGEWIKFGGINYLLTNYRAIVYDFETNNIDLRDRFNTEKECKIIKQYFKVFKYKVDLPTRSQMVRHRVSWQELSRRYVSGKRKELEFYVSDKMKKILALLDGEQVFNIEDCIDFSVNLYNNALENKVNPEEARRILPQGLYTELWGAFQPKQLDNFFKLRLDSHAQKEIRLTAEAMQELIINEGK